MKSLVVAKREYLERVKKRSFFIGTIMGPVLMGAMIFVPALLLERGPLQRVDIAVVDLTNSLFPRLSQALNDTLPSGEKVFALIEEQATEAELDVVKKRLNEQIEVGTLEGYIVIPTDAVEAGKITYFGRKVSNLRTLQRLERAMNEAILYKRLSQAGLDYGRIQNLMAGVKLETVQVLKGSERQGDFEQAYLSTTIFIMMLYMTILLWGMAVQRSIIDEKNSRIVEVLLSSLKPLDLMTGKILGVGAVGLTQYAIWAAFALGASAYLLSSGMYAGIAAISGTTIAFFVIFYVLGFLFYATLYAAIGAVCNSDQEAQQLQTPITMCLAFTIVVSMAIMQNPDGRFATVFSMIPFFAPIMMFMRINILTPPIWQIAASVAILAASIYAAGILSAKIFRVGILMYGKRPDLREIAKWLRRA